MDTLPIVTYRNRSDNAPKPQEISWGDLQKQLTTHIAKASKDSQAWSPTCYAPGKTRANENVITVSCFVGDIDDGTPVSVLREQWKTPGGKPLAFALHSSYSSTLDLPKYRVVFPLAHPVPAAEWPVVHRKLTMALLGTHADPSCKDIARLYYLPACPPEQRESAFADLQEGELLNPADFPDPAPEEASEAQMRYIFRDGPPAAKGDGRSGGGRPGDDFNERGDVLGLLEQRGWEIVSQRGEKVLLRRPGKVADYSATFGYGGTRMFYCFTSNASPFESNTGYSPFGVYAELQHNGDYQAAARRLRAEGYGEDRVTKTAVKQQSNSSQKTEAKESPPDHQEPKMTAAMVQGLPMVETNGRHLRDESTDALNALIQGNTPPAIFVRGGQLSRVQVNEKNRAVITGLTTPMLRGHMARTANFVSTSEKRGCVPIAPPKDVVEDVLALPQWPGVPPLTGIVTAPVFAQDGRMEAHAGYHAGAKLYYHETCPVPIPDTTPTPENVAAARSLIMGELLADFPFADEASRAHAVALLLLPFVRPMIDGPAPLHLIDAPTAGTGKGLLAKVCTLPFTAEGTAAKSPPTEEAEWSKTLTSVFSDGDSHLLLDNVRFINSPSFFAAITATLYKDRLLGTNRTSEFENRLVWLATANNIQGNDELNRRSIWIRLDAGVEQPEDRDGFQHPDLAGWAALHRGELIGAALTLGRAWVEAGKPSYAGTEKPLGSFEAWTRVMGGILQNAGIPGFLENRQEQRSRVDTETTSWHGFVESWLDRFGKIPVTTGDLFPLALEWMPERMGDPGKDESNRSQKMKFAKLLTRHVDKVFAGHKIVQAGKATSGVSKNLMQYQLEATQSRKTGSGGSGGSGIPIPRVVVSEQDNTYNDNIHIGQPGNEDSHHSHHSRFEADEDDFEVII